MKRVHGLLIIVCAAFVVAACKTAPPVQEMSDARLAIAAAKDVDAAKHAPEEFREARRLLKSAETNLERRAYSAARRDADLAKRQATVAREKSEQARSQPNRDQTVPIK